MSETRNLTAGTTLARLLGASQGQTEKVAKGCPADRRLFTLGPNKAHPLWLLGHLGNTAEFIGNYIGFGKPSGHWPREWAKRFTPEMFGGDKISTNAADYPSMEEVLAAYTKVFEALRENVAAASDGELLAGPKGELPAPLKTMISSLQDCISLNVVHDSHHRGQMALLAAAPK